MSSRTLDFTANDQEAYYAPGDLTYTVTANVNSKPVSITKTLNLVKGKKYVLNVKANTNGTIGLTINYTEMVNGEAQNVTIDAATGTEVNS